MAPQSHGTNRVNGAMRLEAINQEALRKHYYMIQSMLYTMAAFKKWGKANRDYVALNNYIHHSYPGTLLGGEQKESKNKTKPKTTTNKQLVATSSLSPQPEMKCRDVTILQGIISGCHCA